MTDLNPEAIAALLELEAKAVRFADCPPGLFWFGEDLFLKSEYSTQVSGGKWEHDAYCCETGEYFAGSVNSYEERDNLLVLPTDYEDFIKGVILIRPLAEAYRDMLDAREAAAPGNAALAKIEALEGIRAYHVTALKQASDDKAYWGEPTLSDTNFAIRFHADVIAEIDRRLAEIKGPKS